MDSERLGGAAEPLQTLSGPAHIAIPPSEAALVSAPDTAKLQKTTATPKAKEAKPVVPYYKLFR